MWPAGSESCYIAFMKLLFTKMHGLGNDFVVIDGVNQGIEITGELARKLADRHFGVGCDQILLVEKPTVEGADFRYRIWNQDGGEVEQCGNGARCFARFVLEKGLTQKKELRVETKKGIIMPRVAEDGNVTVDMGRPVFEATHIPFIGSDEVVQHIVVDGASLEISVTSMGNPHATQVVSDVDAAAVTTQGPLIENHKQFPERVNAGYMQIVDEHTIKLRVWERGAGETLACGTGACAAAVSGIRRGLLQSPVKVQMHGGELTIEWRGDHSPVLMTGQAVSVFEGGINL